VLSNTKATAGEWEEISVLLSEASKLERADIAIDVPFLRKTALESEDQRAVRLALCVLARKGGDEARDVFYTVITKRPVWGVQILYFADLNDVRSVASRLVMEAQEPAARIGGANLLAAAGDKQSAEILKKEIENTTDASVRRAMQRAVSRIDARERNVPAEEREEWCRQELRYETLMREAFSYRALEAGVGIAAMSAAERGEKFTASFLRDKIENGDQSTAMLAIALAGEGRVAELVDEISSLADDSGGQGVVARAALVRMGGDAALEAIAKQIKPAATERNSKIARLLAHLGDESAIRLLRKYVDDPQYKESRTEFEQAIDAITKRLKAKQEHLESQPAARP
jgi:hypothetical protein